MKPKQGISLIVLVITIIVMIVLAGAIILTLNNSGIIDKATDAVEQSNLATVKELTQMAWAEAYAGGERTEEGLKAAVDKALEDNKVDTTKYEIEVTTKGVTVVLKGPWVQTRETVTDGKITINVGEKINYTATGTSYAGDWKVLGASEYGELLIMSDSDVTTHRLGYKSTTTDSTQKLKESQEAWLNGASELDEICEVYGKGEGATGARSVTVEDINRVTGYDPETEKYGEGQIYEYGNEVTYSYNGTTNPAYSGSNGKTGMLSEPHTNGFHYYDGVNFVKADLSKETGKIIKVKNNDYSYGLRDGNLGLTEESALMLFGEYDEDNDYYSAQYCLASPFISTDTYYVCFGLRMVDDGDVFGEFLWFSDEVPAFIENGVRAVVSLDTDVNISASTSGGWNIK